MRNFTRIKINKEISQINFFESSHLDISESFNFGTNIIN